MLLQADWQAESFDTCAPPVRKWSVARVKVREEKDINRRLQDAGLETYLPLLSRAKYYPSCRRTVLLETARFPGYVYVGWRGVEELYRIIDMPVDKVFGLLRISDQAALLSHMEKVRDNIDREPLDSDGIVPGAVVEVSCGALRGLQGKVGWRNGRRVKLIEVELLGRQVDDFETDVTRIEPI